MAQSNASDPGSSEITYMDTALYKAAADGDINFLNSSSADLQLQLTPKKNTVLHIAAQFGQAGCVTWILQLHSCSCLLLQPNLNGDTPLHLAARGGHLIAVKALIYAAKTLPKETERGVEPDKAMVRMKNKEGDTALHEAVRFRHPKVVELFIEEDPSLTTAANICGETPLYMAAEIGFRELVKIIIDNTCSRNISPSHTGFKGNTALHAAAIGNHKEIVKKVLQWKPDLAKEVDENGWSPLHCAAYLGHTSIVKELLEKCEKSVVYLAVKNDDNKTALHIAASRGHVDIVKLLVSHSPDCCEQVDEKGNNALHLLMPERNLPLTQRLLPVRWLNARGLLNEKNNQGQTPVHLLNDFLPPHNKLLIMGFVSLMRNCYEEKIPLVSLWRSAKARSAWEKIAEGNEISSRESQERDEEISGIKKASKYHLIVAALIATVTFAAGFTVPGGYVQSGGVNQGMAVLAATTNTFANTTSANNTSANNSNYSIRVNNGPFRVFIWIDTIALASSMMAVTLYFLMALYNNKQLLRKLFYYAYCLTLTSICATVVAFLSGLLAVLQPSTFLETSMWAMTNLFLGILASILQFSPRPDDTVLFDEGKLFSPYFVGCSFSVIAGLIYTAYQI